MCRVFKKRLTTVRKMDEHEPLSNWYDDQVSLLPDFESRRQITDNTYTPFHNVQNYTCKQELGQLQHFRPHERCLQLPQLERQEVPHSAASVSFSPVVPYGFEHPLMLTQEDKLQHCSQFTDWQVLDNFVASQLGQDNQDTDVSKTRCSNDQVLELINLLCNDLRKQDHVALAESTSMSTLSCQSDLWK